MGTSEQAASAHADGQFVTTHWTIIGQAGGVDSPESRAAAAQLCQAYWYPLYVYLRRTGRPHEDAEDLVQGFFARVLEKNYFEDADRAKGRFRSFLLLALKRYLANEWDRARRLKRGGGYVIESLDIQVGETRFLNEPADPGSPDKAFDRNWAEVLLARVLERLRCELLEADKGRVFDELKSQLLGDEPENSYEEIGRRLGLSEANVKVTVFRLRKRYRELLRREISRTLADSDSVEVELRHLIEALSE